jgi:glutaredoxin
MAKTYLDEQGVKYQDLDVTEDAASRDEMIQKSGQMGVPVITLNGELVIGFNKERLEDLLKAGNSA